MPIFELRVAITAEEFEKLVRFYRDGLGLVAGEMWTNNGQGQLFHAGQAVLEILDTEHSAFVDQVEVGERVTHNQVRFALCVPDLQRAIDKALNYGATLVHEPVITPWGDRNARIQAPDGLQITLFQVGSNNRSEPENE